jgi:hypothetical protein
MEKSHSAAGTIPCSRKDKINQERVEEYIITVSKELKECGMEDEIR